MVGVCKLVVAFCAASTVALVPQTAPVRSASVAVAGRGDQRTKKGKVWSHSNGICRTKLQKKEKGTVLAPGVGRYFTKTTAIEKLPPLRIP